MKKTYILTRDVNCPVVATGGTAHKQTQMRMRRFRRGQLVQGELKHSNNRPAFILVGRMCVIPIDAVKEIQGKDVVSKFEGADMDQQKKAPIQPAPLQSSNPKVKYLDALLIGGLVGFVAVYFAEKKGYITSEDNKNKMYGAIGGAILGAYLVYRHETSKKVIVKPTTTKQ